MRASTARLTALLVATATVGACGRLGYDATDGGNAPPECEASPCAPRCDAEVCVPPCEGEGCDGLRVAATTIAGGAARVIGPGLEVQVVVQNGTAPRAVRVAEAPADGSCQARFADDGWVEVGDDGLARLVQIVLPTDGPKKVCAWARDASGAVTVIDPPEGREGVDTDTVELRSERPPVVEAFTVRGLDGDRVHGAGEPLRISWVVTDAEALAEAPITLDVTTDGQTWAPLVEGLGAPLDAPHRAEGETDAVGAPTDAPFRLRLIATDADGNRSVAALSDVQNVSGWSVYLGSRDHGLAGGPRAVQLRHRTNAPRPFAIDPATGDAYAVDQDRGVIRYDALSGAVETFVAQGSALQLPDGPIGADARVPRLVSLGFGPGGRLYLGARDDGTDQGDSGVIVQIDPVARTARRYVGGGTDNDASADPGSVFAHPFIFTFDEAGALYFHTSCEPGANVGHLRLMRLTQAADGAPGELSVVAGDCSGGAPDEGPTDALASPLGSDSTLIGSVAVWDEGRVLYYGGYDDGVWKIVDGVQRRADVSLGGGEQLVFDPVRRQLLGAHRAIVRIAPDPTGEGSDEIVETLVASDGTGDCARDGAAASAACVDSSFGLEVLPDGRVFFADGAGFNQDRPYRVRFVDEQGRLGTYLGRPPFHGDGLHRRLAVGRMAAIHVKRPTDPNQDAFGPGLWLVDPGALVLAHVDPTDDLVRVVWGNQSSTLRELMPGEPIGPDRGVGVAYGGGELAILAFDEEGLPWLRYGPSRSRSHLISLDASRRVVVRARGTRSWELATDGDDPAGFHLWPYGGVRNLAVHAGRAFLSGAYDQRGPPVIQLLDFAAGETRRVVGGAEGVSPDRTTPGTASSASLSETCVRGTSGDCFVRYRADQDRLYVTELDALRYVTTPADPTTSTLVTLFDGGAGRLGDFVFGPDDTYVLYVVQGGGLHCRDLGGAPAWCDGSRLGPPEILGRMDRGPNQLSWLDDDTLLVSTQHGDVLAFDLPR